MATDHHYSNTDRLHHNHYSPCAQSIRFSWRKTYHSLTLRHKLLYATSSVKHTIHLLYARHLARGPLFAHPWHRRICKSSLLKWKHWPSTEGGTNGPRPEKLMRFVFDMPLMNFFYKMKCFRKKSESVSETKIIFF